jgi:DNA primase
MAGLYSEDLKRRVREANNLVDVVQAAVGKLVRAGRNLKACCPFHNEKTPSFNVNAEGHYFKCFGCGKSGDVFSFIQLYERVDFPEAFKILADRAGIRVETTPDPVAAQQYKKETDWKSYLYRLNEVAAKFYREQLFAKAGTAAREYLKKRGLNDEICEEFGLGYAPANGSPLMAQLTKQKAPTKAILLAGLASQRDDGSVRDFFYDRLMFPIRDIQGRVIAFGGRILGDGEPKYLNTRDTPLFSKTRTVYGLNTAREEIVKTRKAILVEGYTDVMMCHQFGVTNVVACLGTAITSEHVRQLRRVADELLMLTDSDAAGAKASERSLGVLFQEEMPARIARLPGSDKDPCDFLLTKGKDPFVEALGQSLELFEYKFERVKNAHDLRTPVGLKNAAQELMELISLVPDTLLKNRYRYEVLKRLNIDERDLAYQTPRPIQTARPEESEQVDSAVVPKPEHELADAERDLLRFLFHQPVLIEEAIAHVDLASLGGGPERRIGTAMLEALAKGTLPPDLETLAAGDAGSIVAREILPMLRSADENASDAQINQTQALCVHLAETPALSQKLDAEMRLNMLIVPIRKAALTKSYQDANLQWNHAKLNNDKEAEEQAYRRVVELRKAISEIKSFNSKKLTAVKSEIPTGSKYISK